jgi:hypothetical protein
MKREELEKWGHSFLLSKDASVVMAMPGCYDAFVNYSHVSRFGGVFELAESPEQCESKLEESENGRTSVNASDESLACYCEKTEAILAFANTFCTFELAYQDLTVTTERWVAGVCFLNNRHFGSERRYKAFRTNARRLPGDYKKFFLESRLLPLGGMEVSVVTSEFNDTNVLPRKLKCFLSLDGRELMQEEFDVPRDPGYDTFGLALLEAKSMLESGAGIETVKSMVSDRTAEVKHRYDPIANFTNSLFSAENPTVVLSRLHEVLCQLFDALVVVKHVKPRIEQWLATEAERLEDISSITKLELIRAIIPYRELEKLEPQVPDGLFDKIKLRKTSSFFANKPGRQEVSLKGETNMHAPAAGDEAKIYMVNFRRAVASFEAQLPSLLMQYSGEFIALCNGEVVDHDSDVIALSKRIRRNFKDKFVLIEKVVARTEIVARMETVGA